MAVTSAMAKGLQLGAHRRLPGCGSRFTMLNADDASIEPRPSFQRHNPPLLLWPPNW
jgi:hypothetical protein